MIEPPVGLVPTSLLGALLGLDVVSFPQAMLSRPLVAATLAGALAGSAETGLIIGATLELFALETLPIGASRYPEWGSAAVVGGTLYAMAERSETAMTAGAMCMAVLFAIATSWVGGRSMVLLRTINGRFARRSMDSLAAGSARTVVGLQLAGLFGDLLRGFLLTLAALLVTIPAQEAALARWHTDGRIARAVVVGLAAMVAGGAVWKLVHAVPRARWLFLGGLLCGLALLAFA
ncbi:phosphotransferase system PTS sorbose-specific IIC subunit [Gemmatirosa kalamazoonensis]|uniref:Phosphotransferase system PTS sorbose-specific IIC subunit n=1 Tax=Gemmatirosa kalamazoonensis TaxID=861299 RepID=W0RIP8_9BACT|nr:PTS sugar transporter subunit IIC [Gemmatirosa kalamazoonensis]AHG90661.1 phosphotransferase system PTS sorbose-specific IIC subunit [Gemmatirosa kalamazoonensis]